MGGTVRRGSPAQAERAGGASPAADALAQVRALVATSSILDSQLEEAVRAARAAGVDGHQLAHALRVGRATLYRRFPVGAD